MPLDTLFDWERVAIFVKVQELEGLTDRLRARTDLEERRNAMRAMAFFLTFHDPPILGDAHWAVALAVHRRTMDCVARNHSMLLRQKTRADDRMGVQVLDPKGGWGPRGEFPS